MLLPIKKILCPIDFSDSSYEALKQAGELCSHFGATLCLLYVLPAMPRPVWAIPPEADLKKFDADLSEYEDALRLRTQQKLQKALEQHFLWEAKSYVLVSMGDAANEIVRIAEDEHASLIVIATHGMTGWPQVALGSVAERVVRLSTRPVLTIRSPGVK